MLVRIPNDPLHAGKGSQLLGCALGVAASHENLAAGIFAMYAANGGARILIGRGGYGAGIEHDELGFNRGGGTLQAALGQLAFYGSSVRLGGAAAKILDVVSRHGSIVT